MTTSATRPELLAPLARSSEFQHPRLLERVVYWLASEFEGQRHARLDQAGQVRGASGSGAGRALDLGHVFIDLPCGQGGQGGQGGASLAQRLHEQTPVPDEGAAPEDLPPGVMAELLALAPVALPASMADPYRTEPPELAGRQAPERQNGQLLLIGGPGQGKSTVGQFLCQMHRAALLDEHRAHLSERVHRALDEWISATARAGFQAPDQPCLSAHIDLGRLIAWCDERGIDDGEVVCRYLAWSLSQASRAQREPDTVPLGDVHRLLALVPWVVVFDGLDEVPAPRAREIALSAIYQFRARLAEEDGRALLVVSTRPQGFDRARMSDFATRELSPLSPARALAYARRLVDYRYVGEPERANQVFQRLREACREPVTRRLLRTPLQVTIMASLVERVGQPPHQRWQLFDDYYRIIFDREIASKGRETGDLLRRYRGHIRDLHRHVGLILQAATESDGNADSLLGEEELLALIDIRLEQAGFPAQERARLGADIARVAAERLVFLVSPRTRRYGFELRSLQEFMAAEALMRAGERAQIGARLRTIAPSASWRNVLLFCASKCFADQPELLDTLVAVCRELDDAPYSGPIAAGAALALAILEDGSGEAHPGHARELARCALGLLDLPPSRLQVRLARLATVPQCAPLGDELWAALERESWPEGSAGLGRWVALIALVDADMARARELAEARWPAALAARQDIIAAYDSVDGLYCRWLRDRLFADFDQLPAPWLRELQVEAYDEHGYVRKAEVAEDDHTWRWAYNLANGHALWSLRNLQIRLQPRERWQPTTPASVGWRPLFPDDLQQHLQRHGHSSWRFGLAIDSFLREPSAATLAAQLRRLATNFEPTEYHSWIHSTPWPLASCVLTADSSDELRELAARAESGELGDVDDWLQATGRLWRGVTVSELLAVDSHWPRVPHIATSGVYQPDVLRQFYLVSEGIAGRDTLIQRCVEELQHVPLPALRQRLAQGILRALRERWSMAVDRETLARLCAHVPLEPNTALRILVQLWSLNLERADKDAWMQTLSELTEPHLASRFYLAGPTLADKYRLPIAALRDMYCADPSRHGALALLIGLHVRWPDDFLPRNLLEQSFASERYRDIAAWWLLRLHVRSPDDLSPALHEWLDSWVERLVGGKLGSMASDIHELVPVPAMRMHMIQRVLRALSESDWDQRRLGLIDWRTAFGQQPTGLDTRTVWTQLSLPGPSLDDLVQARALEAQPVDATTSAASMARQPAHRPERIHITGLRVLRDVTIELSVDWGSPAADAGRWMVFLGENGAGKSTILRALVLALADTDIVQALMADQSAPLASGADGAHIAVTIAGQSFAASVRSARERERVEQTAPDGVERPLLFAYGCHRGSAIGGPARELNLGPRDAVDTLFDDNAYLISTETWLKLRYLNKLKYPAYKHPERHDEAIYEAVHATLLSVLPGVDSIDIDMDSVFLSGQAVGERVALTGLSDGYVATIGWICDLMARWLDWAERCDISIPRDFPAHMQALVLVDEIDMHLHPRWQRQVIKRLRERFPRVSFVVTTHNPLVLLGARPGEIFVLKRAPRGDVTAIQTDVPPGTRADQVLTGEWFGVGSTIDDETLDYLREYRALLSARAPADDPRRRELADILEQRLARFPAATTLEDMAQQVLGELASDDPRERTLEERRALLARYREEMLQRLDAAGE